MGRREDYEEMRRQLLRGRKRGDFDGDEGESLEDDLLAAMDACWWDLSDEERAIVEKSLLEEFV